mmetsp:Transcript_23093/g.49171  ORF Transcript_23093/g.49171 Transcript_23093/m.49171 type:complete len:211 (+) Transcript_23093:676-1308(+)
MLLECITTFICLFLFHKFQSLCLSFGARIVYVSFSYLGNLILSFLSVPEVTVIVDKLVSFQRTLFSDQWATFIRIGSSCVGMRSRRTILSNVPLIRRQVLFEIISHHLIPNPFLFCHFLGFLCKPFGATRSEMFIDSSALCQSHPSNTHIFEGRWMHSNNVGWIAPNDLEDISSFEFLRNIFWKIFAIRRRFINKLSFTHIPYFNGHMSS